MVILSPPPTPPSKGGETSIATAEVLHGKQLSYNNILDADAALNLVKEFSEPAVSVIKHTNPAGCAVGDDIDEAYEKAYQGDPRSAFGGIIAMNRNCTKNIAEKINKVFMEIVLAPDYDSEALGILKQYDQKQQAEHFSRHRLSTASTGSSIEFSPTQTLVPTTGLTTDEKELLSTAS